MHLSQYPSSLFIFALALSGAGMTKPLAVSSVDDAAIIATDKPTRHFMSHKQMMHWIATTDAELTFIGQPINPLAPRSARTTMLSFCSTFNATTNTCGGPCTVYNGGPQCLNAPDTNCLASTTNVGFCDTAGCINHCHDFATCGTLLADGFCYTPGTEAILVCTS